MTDMQSYFPCTFAKPKKQLTVLLTSSTCISFTYFPIAEWRCTSEHALVQMTARVSDVIWVTQITFKFVDINGCLASFPIFLLV